MVHLLVNIGFGRPARNLLGQFTAELGAALTIETYPSVLVRRRLDPGTYIFGDLDRLPRSDRPAVHALWDQLAASGAAWLQNDPRHVLLRYALLRRLWESGVNRFNVYRADEDLGRVRFPAFVRFEHDHGGPRSRLLHSSDELRQELARLAARREWRTGLMVTEVAAEPDPDGLYRKYGALLINGRVIACHLIASRTWMVKGKVRVVTPALADEELRYVVENPHAAELAPLFRLAGVDYGRIDYGFVGGRLQVYEINTNPSIIGAGMPSHPERRPKRHHLAPKLIDAFQEMARQAPRPATTSIPVQPRDGWLPAPMYQGLRTAQSLWRRYLERPGLR